MIRAAPESGRLVRNRPRASWVVTDGSGGAAVPGSGRAGFWLMVPLLVTMACGPASRAGLPDGSSSGGDTSQQASRQRGSITMAVAWEPDQLGAKGTGGESG